MTLGNQTMRKWFRDRAHLLLRRIGWGTMIIHQDLEAKVLGGLNRKFNNR